MHTHIKRFDLDIPDDKCADTRGAAIDDGVIRYHDALGPARIISIVVFVCFVVAESNGSGGEDGIDRDI